ncbi:MAG: hypothetical protein QOH26_138 [Actinomycetota bacterium]|nr:hypothetical protein [Actinomycetota bacterium]
MRYLKVVLVLVFLAVVGVGAVAGFALAEGGTTDATKWEWARGIFLKERSPGAIGKPGADADLRLTVTDFSCTPRGVSETCIAKVDVRSASEDETELKADLQYLHLDDIVVAATEVTPSEKVASGDQEKEIVWREVPSGGVRQIELHEGLLSGGILIKLRSE